MTQQTRAALERTIQALAKDEKQVDDLINWITYTASTHDPKKPFPMAQPLDYIANLTKVANFIL